MAALPCSADNRCLVSSVFLSAHEAWATLSPHSMARARSERSKSKPSVTDELTQSIEQFQDLLPDIEDLGRDGFPYLEGSRAKAELQLRECIKRAFGEKSPEFQAHRQHKLSIGSSPEHNKSVDLVKSLIASLEEKKLELQGTKSSNPDEPPPEQLSTKPKITLVPPSPQLSNESVPAPLSSVSTDDHPVNASKTVSPVEASQGTVSPPMITQPPMPAAARPPQKGTPALTEESSREKHPHDTASVTQPISTAPPSSSSPSSQPHQPQATEMPSSSMPSSVPTHDPAGPNSQTFSETQEIVITPTSVSEKEKPPAKPISDTRSSSMETEPLTLCKQLCYRFHAIARQLRLRGEYRSTLSIEDEIDVQDLLHALLRVQFDDIGADEWNPSYANGQTRTTFLLNNNRLAIVVKKTRPGLTTKEIAEQVRMDADRYQRREQCTGLLCFIYDPEGRIGNPRGMENDLASVTDHFTVDAFVAPKS